MVLRKKPAKKSCHHAVKRAIKLRAGESREEEKQEENMSPFGSYDGASI